MKQKLIIIALAIIAITTTAHAQQQYSVTDLGIAHPIDRYSRAMGINNAGQIAGFSFHGLGSGDGQHPFIWDLSTGMTNLPRLTEGVYPNNSGTSAINDFGQVVGSSTVRRNVAHAVLWDTNGQITDLGDLPGGEDSSTAKGINNHGQIVGHSHASTGTHVVTWDTNGNMTELKDQHGNRWQGLGKDINDLGQITGDQGSSSTNSRGRGFFWDPVTGKTDLGDLPGGDIRTSSVAINNSGQVTGSSYAATGQRAFIWDSDNGMINLGDLPGGSDVSEAYGLNDSGAVVGFSSSTDNRSYCGFIWDENNGMQNLNSMLDQSGQGWDIRIAIDINNSGQIVGYGINPDGQGRAFLLNPVPEPTTLTLLTLSTINLIRRKRK